jgi:uncharacterized protein (DUF362 family)
LGVVALFDVVESVRQVVDEILDISEFSVDPNVPIIIKPNLCAIKSPETGATTDPIVVEALIDSIREKFNARDFFIVESNATMLNADLAFRLLGYHELADRAGARIVNLSSIPFRYQSFPQNFFLHKIKIPKLFWKPHVLISVGKLKTHGLCGFSGTLKNLYGCNPEPHKVKYHGRLHQAIADIASAFRADLSVIDSLIAMEGEGGPVSGNPVRLNKIIAGNDPVSVDACVGRLIGIDPRKIEYVRLSEKSGVGSTDYKLVCPGPQCLPLKLPNSITDKLVSHTSNLVQLIRRNKRSAF